MLSVTPTDAPAPVQPTERIAALDVLRGIALLGMIVAHFSYYTISKDSGATRVVNEGLNLFVHERFYTLFAMLFGAGFAVQYTRAKAKGRRFVPRYLRRLLALFGFGMIASIGFGFNVLEEYALFGGLLLLVSNWSTRAVVALLVVCLMTYTLYRTAYSTVYAAAHSTEEAKRMNQQKQARQVAFWQAYRQRDSLAGHTPSYTTALAVRARGVVLNYSDPEIVGLRALAWPFVMFLFGFLGVRTGLFEHPERHRRLLLGVTLFGLACWVLDTWVLPFFVLSPAYTYPNIPYGAEVFLGQVANGLGIIRGDWIALTYAGLVLLAASYKPLKGFSAFRWAGRMALTNYMLQVMLFSLLFSGYALALPEYPAVLGPLFAVLLFSVLVLGSRWWLARYNYGPLEWVWRTVTYWKRQPLRKTIQETGAWKEPAAGTVAVVGNPSAVNQE